MSDTNTTPQPEIKRRTRKATPASPEVKPIEIEFVDTPPQPNQHDVIQVTTGENRGVLCQVGEWTGSIYKCYIINSPNPPGSINVKPGDYYLVGKAKVASRNPFPAQPAPEPLPEVDEG